ncbi:uncharacterized protein [Drosophila bipectinata]
MKYRNNRGTILQIQFRTFLVTSSLPSLNKIKC